MKRIVMFLMSTITIVVLLFGYRTSTSSTAAGRETAFVSTARAGSATSSSTGAISTPSATSTTSTASPQSATPTSTPVGRHQLVIDNGQDRPEIISGNSHRDRLTEHLRKRSVRPADVRLLLGRQCPDGWVLQQQSSDND
jgi:hypothetical protein